MMKTPDEIKKGLECCKDYQSCTEYGEPKCPYNNIRECVDTLLDDALAYIQQLEAERDAAVKDLKTACELCAICHACKDRFEGGEHCRDCYSSKHWQWRGVQKE